MIKNICVLVKKQIKKFFKVIFKHMTLKNFFILGKISFEIFIILGRDFGDFGVGDDSGVVILGSETKIMIVG